MSKMKNIHTLLTNHYEMLLANGCEDPKILKEIREFLRDNNINEETLSMLQVANDVGMIELPDDEEWQLAMEG